MITQGQPKYDRQNGYTIIEVMIVVALIGIVFAFAVPQYQRMVSGNKVRTTTDSLLHDLNVVKAASRERGGNVVICKSDNSDAAAPNCSNVASDASSNTGWAGGWIAFRDNNGNSQYELGDDLIFVQPRTMNSFTEGSVVPNPNILTLTFNATGQSTVGAVQFFVKGSGSTDASRDRYVCIGLGGRIMVSKTATCN